MSKNKKKEKEKEQEKRKKQERKKRKKEEKNALPITLERYVKFPIKVDRPGLYIFDAAGDMVADAIPDESRGGVLKIAAAACNALHGHASSTPALPSRFTPPFHFDPEEQEVLDVNDACILRIRGWGHLSKFGDEAAIAVQALLGETFVRSLNTRYAQNK